MIIIDKYAALYDEYSYFGNNILFFSFKYIGDISAHDNKTEDGGI